MSVESVASARCTAPRTTLVRISCALLVTAFFFLQGCAGPNRRALTIGGAGGALAGAGAGLWVAGARGDSDGLATVGVVSVGVGVALIVTATSLLAYRTACQADADCEEGETCREVPAPAGREPYSQCVPR